MVPTSHIFKANGFHFQYFIEIMASTLHIFIQICFVTGLSDVTLLDNHCVPFSRNSANFVALEFNSSHISGSFVMKLLTINLFT